MQMIIRNVLERHLVDLLMEVRRNNGWSFVIVVNIYQLASVALYLFEETSKMYLHVLSFLNNEMAQLKIRPYDRR